MSVLKTCFSCVKYLRSQQKSKWWAQAILLSILSNGRVSKAEKGSKSFVTNGDRLFATCQTAANAKLLLPLAANY